MKKRILALALACLMAWLATAVAEEKPVTARLVLEGLQWLDDDSFITLEDEPSESMDVITFYADKTAVADIRYSEDGSMPTIRYEGTWEHFKIADLDLYELSIVDPATGETATWPIQREGDYYALYVFSGASGNKRMLREVDVADPSGAEAPADQPADQPVAEAPAPARDELPDVISSLTVPFSGTADEHRQALSMWAPHFINQQAELTLAAAGEGDGYVWERYEIPGRSGDSDATYQLYLILDASGEQALAYAGGVTMDMGAPVDAFAEAVRLVESDMGNMQKSREIADSFDADRMDREMAALIEAIQAPGAGAGTAYYRYAHYVTIVPSERDGEPFYWFVYHSAPEDGGDAAEAASEPAAQAEPEPQAETAAQAESEPQAEPIPVTVPAEGWTCENGHAGNTGKFCTECGAPMPAPATPSFCPECGHDLRGTNVKFCTECGTPVV